jgi:hypothetical protein
VTRPITATPAPLRAADSRAGRRDLAIAAVTAVGLSRLLDGDAVWLVAVLVLAAMLVGALQVLAEDDPAAETSGVPIESVILPAVATIGCMGVIRLVPFGLGLVPALVLTALLVLRALTVEGRILASRTGAGPDDRTAVLVLTLIIAFLGFTGVAAVVRGGLSSGSGSELAGSSLALLAAADAVVAFLLGYRTAALRVTNLRDALWSAATYAGAIAIGAAAVRAMEIPRLVGPALLVLAFYLWDAFHGAPATRRRDIRWLWQTVLLVVLGLIVLAWNWQIRS